MTDSGIVFSFLILLSTTLFAESYRMNADYYVRSSANFSDSNHNKVGVLKKGSTFKILQTKRIGKAEALKIRVTSLSPSAYVLQSEEYWIYKPNNIDFLKTSPEKENSTEGQATDVPCESCLAAAQKSPDANTKNTSDIADISKTITAQQNQVEPGNLDEIIKKYSESDEVKYSIDFAIRKRKPRSQGYCYRSVKKALLAAPKGKKGLIPEHYSDLAALNAKNSLKKYGFINLLDTEPYKTQITSPTHAPKGAVLVYSSGIPCGRAKDCGHTEIKTGDADKPGYVSDYYSKNAINETDGARKYGTRYKLVGVMIKP